MEILQEGVTLQDGKYTIKSVLGKGGFGVTYLAMQEILDRPVAIKEFYYNAAPDITEKFRQKFIKEAKTISMLQHPGIIQIYDIFKDNGTAYYVMEYIEGVSLADMIKKNGPLPEYKAVEYITAAANALKFIHDRNITHLDVKPANIMVRKRDDKVVLIDFGVAKQYDEETNEGTTTTPVGLSHGYSPLEQYRKNGVNTFSPQSDVYALAATLYKLLTGKTPQEAVEVMEKGLDLEPLKQHDVSVGVIEAIVNAMKSRQKRTQTVGEFALAISLDDDDETVTLSNSQVKEEEEDDATVVMSEEKPAASKSDAVAAKPAAKKSVSAKKPSEAKESSAPIFEVVSANKRKYIMTAAAVAVIAVIGLIAAFGKKNPADDNIANDNIAAITDVPEAMVDTTPAGLDVVAAEQIAMAAEKTAETIAEKPVDDVQVAKDQHVAEKTTTTTAAPKAETVARTETTASVSGKSQTFNINGVSFTMKQVAKGTFFMGATDEQTNADTDESPSHQVTLKTFYLGETEVTQELWQAVMGSNPASFKGKNMPVESVSWNDCQSFISKLNAATGQKFRLPTEAEWEFAARGGHNSDKIYSGAANLAQVGWYSGNSSGSIHIVKGKSANELGFYDMSGNVAEWCNDWYGKYRISHEMNPKGASSGSERVARGGSVAGGAEECRTSSRLNVAPSTSSPTLGLRLAL